MDEYQIQLIDRTTSFPLPSRQGDVFLMEAFAAQGFSKNQLIILNRCRLYLQVMTTADIMNGFGNRFTLTFKCQKDHQRHNNFKWPFQPAPSTRMKKFWRKALRKTFGLAAGIMDHKLGPWLHNDHSQWIWFYHPVSQAIMQRFGKLWRMWKQETSRGRLGKRSRFKIFTTQARIPPTVKKATVQFWTPNRITLTGWATCDNELTTVYSEAIGLNAFPLDETNDER